MKNITKKLSIQFWNLTWNQLWGKVDSQVEDLLHGDLDKRIWAQLDIDRPVSPQLKENTYEKYKS